ncbi:MAG: BMC domain-containing protein [Bryobacteraceae bacterium]
MVILDAMEKTARVQVLQAELNDQPGVCLKLTGPLGDVRTAAQTAEMIAGQMQVSCIVDVIAAPGPSSSRAFQAAADYNPLIEQPTVHLPRDTKESKDRRMAEQAPFAVGLIETQGFTAVFEAIDTAVKTAAVEVLAREKLGGGYITVVIKGDVAAVRAAIDAGKARVEGLGRLIAAHVIPSPSAAVLSLLPKL